ncbi:LysM peptidoglycan-binding domain-containing protein [Chryseobacterium vaccae]|uniref:LysM peptidoglycan-binding domain-containing protein n=1 Tax=Chryseobacterium vaccae TaxID=2604424 RepID=UPI0012959F35|nr:LysM domain-containing protein [Chryseobacterium vaccae]
MQKFNRHTIQKNETLQSIASLYGMDADALKLFHNNQCEVKDMILIGLTSQKELFLPRTAVADKNSLVKFGPGNTLLFQPEHSFQRYAAAITIDNGSRRSELKYETSVRWLKTENKLHFFEIDRTSALYLNEEEVNEIADLLAYKTSKVLYPLQISTDRQGKFNAVENLSVFKERWPAVKEEVYQLFEGETVDQYCQKIEYIVDEPDAIGLYLKNDYFLRTLFFGIYQRFGEEYETEITETFPVVDNVMEPVFGIKLETDPLKDEYDLIQIKGGGILNDERSVNDFIAGTPFSLIIDDEGEMNHDGSITLHYFLNGKTTLAESIYLECDIKLEQEKKIAVEIAAITE